MTALDYAKAVGMATLTLSGFWLFLRILESLVN